MKNKKDQKNVKEQYQTKHNNKTEELVEEKNKVEKKTEEFNRKEEALQIEKIRTLMVEKEEENRKNLELIKYLQADFDNLKKRHIKEIINTRKYSIKNFAKRVLVIIDSVEKSLQHVSADNKKEFKTVKEGLEMSYGIFLKILEEFGVKQMDTYRKNFDPVKHEAITVISKSGEMDNIILDTLQKGYMIDDIVLRSAKVVVCKNK